MSRPQQGPASAEDAAPTASAVRGDLAAGSLQLQDLPQFQARSQVWQRLGWLAMAAFAAAGMAGLFGQGKLSQARAGDKAAGIELEYERFVRASVPTALTVRAQLPRSRAADQTVDLRLGRRYADTALIHAILPAPAEMRADARDLILSFRPPPGAEAAVQNANGPGIELLIRLQLEPLRPGWSEIELQLDGGGRLSAGQLVYP